MAGAAEQTLILRQRVFDLGVLRQHRAVGDAEPLRGLALGGEEIADAVLRHDARGFLRQGPAQILGAWVQLLHAQKIGSEPDCGEFGELASMASAPARWSPMYPSSLGNISARKY